MGIALKVDEPQSVGADRAVNAISAQAVEPGKDKLVISFGTATTLDHIGPHGAYLGGIIAPGVNLSLEALVAAAAKLPRIAIEAPATASVIGRTTESQMLIGVYWGYVSMMEGLIGRMKSEIGKTSHRHRDGRPRDVVPGTGASVRSHRTRPDAQRPDAPL